MKQLVLFESFVGILQENKKEKKDKKWIQKAIKKPGVLHKSLGIGKDENIPLSTINDKIEKLEKEAEGDKKLKKKDRKLLRRLVLAKTLKTNLGDK